MPRKGRLGNTPGEDVTLTPPEIWERLGRVVDPGKAILDPCPHPQVDDGLAGEYWTPEPHGLVYVNGPFSSLYPWAVKAVRTAMHGHSVVMLVPNRSSQPFHTTLANAATMVAYWHGTADALAHVGPRAPGYLPRRVRYLKADGSRMAGAPFDTVLFLLSEDLLHREQFERAFADVACVMSLRPHRHRGPL